MRPFREIVRGYEPYLIVLGLILTFVFVFFWERIFVVIPAGSAGVLFRPLFGGTVIDHPYGPGLNLIFPWDRMYVYNMRVQETTQALTVLTQDGMNVGLDLSIRYRPDDSMVGLLHEKVGPNYVNSIVVPEVLSVVRAAVAQRTAEELVTGRPEQPTTVAASAGATDTGTMLKPEPAESPEEKPENVTLAQIVQSAAEAVSRKYVIVEAVVLMKTTLPERIENAVEQKIEQKQLAEAQSYRLLAAEREIKIKTAEATANNALRTSIDPNLLAWRGIEVTRELAASPNAKMIFIGNKADGLPVVLSGEPRP